MRTSSAGSLYNYAASAATVICPVRRASNGTFANYISAPNVFVVDRSSTADVCCRVVSKNPGGAKIEGVETCSTGAGSGFQNLRLEAIYDNYSWSQLSVVCTLPAKTSLGSSYVLTYRVQQNSR